MVSLAQAARLRTTLPHCTWSLPSCYEAVGTLWQLPVLTPGSVLLNAQGSAQDSALALEAEVAAHLAQASKARSQFLDSGIVHDREELKAALLDVLAEKGQLALLLGGKSVGKSCLLRELAGQRSVSAMSQDGARRALLYVDARSCGGDLAAGLVAALQKDTSEQQRLQGPAYSSRQAQADQPAVNDTLPAAKSVSLELSFKGASVGSQLEFSGTTTCIADQSIALLAKVLEVAMAQGYFLCLILDEANLFFPAPPDPSSALPAPSLSAAQLSAQRQLEKLVELTKQNRQMNVLLVSSEYAYPYRLRHGHFFNSTNLTETLFAGEVPPAAMRELLQQRWGLGPRLADVFLAFYGGHVHMASRALAKLSKQLDRFDCEEVSPDGVLAPIVDCILSESSSSSSSSSPMISMLRTLAQQGFAPVDSMVNVQAKTLSFSNVGGLVKTRSTVVGLPQSLRRDADFGVVPSSQFVVRGVHQLLLL
jgi:hypothetical protein